MKLKLLLEKQDALETAKKNVNTLLQELNCLLLENSNELMAKVNDALLSSGFIFQDSIYVKYNDDRSVSRVRLPLDARGSVFIYKYKSQEEFEKGQFFSNDRATDVLTLLSVLLKSLQDDDFLH